MHANGKKMQDEPEVTPAAAFRRVRERGVVVRLPSGRRVRMRNVQPSHLLKLGRIPDVLTPLVLKILYGKAQQDDFDNFFTLREQVDEALGVIESMRIVCTAALLEPRIVEEAVGEDEIQFEDLSDTEKTWIFNLAFLEAEGLSSFRDGQAADVGLVDEGQELPAAAVEIARRDE